MKINILMKLIENSWGGGNQFLKALKKYFIAEGIYEDDPKKDDVIIFNSFPFSEEYRFNQAYKLKKKLIHPR